MAPDALSRELSVSADVTQAFHALYRDHSHVCWLESLGERGTSSSVLATGTPVNLPDGSELTTLRETVSGTVGLSVLSQPAPLGFVGVLAYDAARSTLAIDAVAPGNRGLSRGLLVTRSLEFVGGRVIAWALPGDHEFENWCDEVEETLRHAAPPPTPRQATPTTATWRDDASSYLAMIHRAHEAIKEGEVYQICLTTSVELEASLMDWELHQILRESSPTQHQALIRLGDYSLVSASPETFLSIDSDGLIRTRPIKGTRPRGATAAEDDALARELVESDKERAENLMIVDLMRNDLQRVCETGSVNVSGLFEVETYSSVHQLVSTVEGQLREDCDGIDALSACFPAGSMTGAPKHRAVSLLAQCESAPRGVYSGIWGWWRADGSMEWAMTIRSALFSEGRVSIGVGGGITWSSVPEQEVAEVGHKARRLLEALGVVSDQYS